MARKFVRAAMYYAHAAPAFSAGIKCWHCNNSDDCRRVNTDILIYLELAYLGYSRTSYKNNGALLGFPLNLEEGFDPEYPLFCF